jgi:hypothetical protein
MLCRVSSVGHSAHNTLPSAGSRALGKTYFLILKNLCRVPDRGHSGKTLIIQTARPLLLLLSFSFHCHTDDRRATNAAARPRPSATNAVRGRPHALGRSPATTDVGPFASLRPPPPGRLPTLAAARPPPLHRRPAAPTRSARRRPAAYAPPCARSSTRNRRPATVASTIVAGPGLE